MYKFFKEIRACL